MHWISVKDRTPDTNTEGHSHDVLVYVRNNCTKRAGISVGQLREGEWWSKTIGRGGKLPRGCEVTHWMELPKEPGKLGEGRAVYEWLKQEYFDMNEYLSRLNKRGEQQ